MSRNAWSQACTTLSNNLESNGRLDSGRKLFRSPASSPDFFNSGRTRACLNAAGKQPEISDLLVMNGDKSPRISFTSHVGAGSRSHVLFTEDLISFSVSSGDTGVHSANVGVVVVSNFQRTLCTKIIAVSSFYGIWKGCSFERQDTVSFMHWWHIWYTCCTLFAMYFIFVVYITENIQTAARQRSLEETQPGGKCVLYSVLKLHC